MSNKIKFTAKEFARLQWKIDPYLSAGEIAASVTNQVEAMDKDTRFYAVVSSETFEKLIREKREINNKLEETSLTEMVKLDQVIHTTAKGASTFILRGEDFERQSLLRQDVVIVSTTLESLKMIQNINIPGIEMGI